MRFITALVLLASSCSAPGGAGGAGLSWVGPLGGAQEVSPKDDAEGVAHPNDEAEHGEEGEHVANLFLGLSANEEEAYAGTIGVDYEYRFRPNFGLGTFLEYIGEQGGRQQRSLRTVAAGLAAYYHPTEHVVLIAGPGAERHHGEWNALMRFGAAYEFHVSETMLVSPGVYFDVSEVSNTLIFGVNIGRIF